MSFCFYYVSEPTSEMATNQKRELLEQYGLNPDDYLSEPAPKVLFYFLYTYYVNMYGEQLLCSFTFFENNIYCTESAEQ